MQKICFDELLSIENIIARRAAMELTEESAVRMNVFQSESYGNVNIKTDKERIQEPDVLLKHAAKAGKAVFTATFTSGLHPGEEPIYEIGEGHIKVLKEGNLRRFVGQVDSISFNGRILLEQGGQIIYVTERCVFELTGEGLLLTEIAPGADIQKDILDQMEFTPLFSENLKQMPTHIFKEN